MIINANNNSNYKYDRDDVDKTRKMNAIISRGTTATTVAMIMLTKNQQQQQQQQQQQKTTNQQQL